MQRRSCHVPAARPIASSSTRAREIGCRAPSEIERLDEAGCRCAFEGDPGEARAGRVDFVVSGIKRGDERDGGRW
jgi:methyl coenzyme M reductase subunit C